VNKRTVSGAIVVGIVTILAALVLMPSEKSERQEIYHARLADPKLYTGGIFTDTFAIEKGTYQFRFVPNGDSPQILSIALKGDAFSFSEDFELEGTPHETGVSTYYTWEYLGQDTIEVSEDQELQIVIDPHGNTLGPVSVYLIK
jgi:hypothetical protein